MDGLSLDVLLILPVLLVSLVLHELGHGVVADWFGDPTPRLMGRLTLNPLPHLDPLGSLVLLLTALSGSVIFGWARPVPVDPRHFRSPQRGMMLVGAAGPAVNFALAVVAAGLIRLVGLDGPLLVVGMLWRLYLLNLFLTLLNLVPIPPLDGSRVLGGLLPAHWYPRWLALDRYGNYLLLILFLLLVTERRAFTAVVEPALRAVTTVLIPGAW